MLTITHLSAFRDNYIWVLSSDQGSGAGSFAVVDPGDAQPVIQYAQDHGLVLREILVTHHHPDHQGGIPALLARWPEARVYGPAAESITGCTHPLSGEDVLEILGEVCAVWAVPGHTRGHLAYVFGTQVFCGDVLFGAGCGRLFEGTPAQMLSALDRLAALPGSTQIYCAHEYTALNLPFAIAVEPGNQRLKQRLAAVSVMRQVGTPTVPLTLAEELATNPFLCCREEAVIEVARAHGAVDAAPVSVFAALRQWRNQF